MSGESTTLYIQKVPAAITQEQLQSGLLAVAKELGIAKTVSTVTLNTKRRFAHVVYTTHESAEKALKALKKTPVEGHILSADWSVVAAKEEDSKVALYVTNLATSTEVSEIQPLFEKYGEVEKAFVITDKNTKASKGQAIVEFKDEDSAEKALALNGTDVAGQTISVEYAKAKRTPRGKGGKQQNSTPRSVGQKRKADGENGNGKQQNSAKKSKAETPKAETRSASAAKTDSPKKESPKKEAKKDTPKKETPKETKKDTPKKETPAVASKDTPKKETPKNQAKATPKKETPKKESTPSKGQEKSKGKK